MRYRHSMPWTSIGDGSRAAAADDDDAVCERRRPREAASLYVCYQNTKTCPSRQVVTAEYPRIARPSPHTPVAAIGRPRMTMLRSALIVLLALCAAEETDAHKGRGAAAANSRAAATTPRVRATGPTRSPLRRR